MRLYRSGTRPVLVVAVVGVAMACAASFFACGSFSADEPAAEVEGGAADGDSVIETGAPDGGDGGHKLRVVWARNYGGDGGTDGGQIVELASVYVDPGGGAFLAGGFQGAGVDFGGGPLMNNGDRDAFVVGVDALGHQVSAKRFGDMNSQAATSVMVNGGNTFVAFNHTGTIDFGQGVFATNAGGFNSVVARLNKSGPVTTAPATGSGVVLVNKLAPDPNSGAYLLGDFTPPAMTIAGQTFSRSTATAIFLARVMDVSGGSDVAMAVGAEGSTCIGDAVASDVIGNAVITGRFVGTMDFGAGKMITTAPTDNDAYVARISSTSNVDWVTTLGGPGAQEGLAAASLRTTDDFIVVGSFSGAINPPGLDGGALTTKGGTDVFVARFDKSGNVVWMRAFGGASDDAPKSVAVDDKKNIFISGTFASPTIDFGGGSLTNAETAGTGKKDVFVAWLDADGQYVDSIRIGGSGEDLASELGVDAMGNVIVGGSFNAPLSVDGQSLKPGGAVDAFLVKLAR